MMNKKKYQEILKLVDLCCHLQINAVSQLHE